MQKVKATCHTEGTGRAPDGSGKPPAGWPGGYKTPTFHVFLYGFSVFYVCYVCCSCCVHSVAPMLSRKLELLILQWFYRHSGLQRLAPEAKIIEVNLFL